VHFWEKTRLDRLRESHAQIIWAMYNHKNVDYVALLWEDFMYQADNREISSARKEHMPYLRFTKLIIDHFISKDNTISMRNMINLHIIRDDTLLEVPDEQTDKPKDTNEGTCEKPEVLDVSKDDSTDSEVESLGDSENESDDVNDDDDDDDDDSGNDDDGNNDAEDSEQTDLDDENPSFTLKDHKEEEQDEKHVFTPEKDKYDDEEEMFAKEYDDVVNELYGDLTITRGLKDIDMTNAKQGGEHQHKASYDSGFVQEEDAFVTLTTLNDKTKGPLQSSSISSDFTSKLLNLDDPSPNINSRMNSSTDPPSPPPVYPSSHPTTIPQQQTPYYTTTTTYLTTTLPKIPNFASLFQFDQMLKEEVTVAVRLQSNKLKEEAEAENQEFFNQEDDRVKEYQNGMTHF
nr:hypothetical protein [Tanacetum cinerariifolium]